MPSDVFASDTINGYSPQLLVSCNGPARTGQRGLSWITSKWRHSILKRASSLSAPLLEAFALVPEREAQKEVLSLKLARSISVA